MIARDDRVTEILTMIAYENVPEATLPDRLCAECLAALPISGAGVALMTSGGPTGVVLGATDERAKQLEELQFSLGEGPCVDASRTGRPVLQPDLVATAVANWPGFGAAALAAGVRAIFAFPLRVGAIRIGILDLYRDTSGYLSQDEFADALTFADAAVVVLLRLQDNAGDAAALTRPIDSRAEIHQATGMISIQLDTTLVEALLRLRAHAYATGRTVSDVAADVVGRRMRFVEGAVGATEGGDGV